MANFDFVSVYDEEDAAWLAERGYDHPAVRPGNEMPTSADMKWALEAEDTISFNRPSEEEELYGKNDNGSSFEVSGFDWDHDNSIPGEYFTVRGSSAILSVLIRLCQRCGQLYLYPDTGDPPIVLDQGSDAQAILKICAEARDQEDQWAYFFKHMYGPRKAAGKKKPRKR